MIISNFSRSGLDRLFLVDIKQAVAILFMILCSFDTSASAPLSVDEVVLHTMETHQVELPYQIQKKTRQESPRQQAERYYHDALLAITRQEIPSAINALQLALGLYEKHHDARELLVALLIRRDDLPLAEQFLDDGLVLKPTHVALYKLKSQLLMQRNMHGEAVAVLEQTIKAYLVDSSYYALLAVGYSKIGFHENAAETYRKILGNEPRNALWWLGLALSLDAMNNTSDALAAYNNAVDRNLPVGRVQLFVHERISTLTHSSTKAGG